MGAAAPLTPPMTIAHSGRAEGGFRSEGAPGERSRVRPSSPPPPGRPRDPDRTRSRAAVRRRQDGGKGREPRAAPQRGSRQAAARPPPPPDPHRPASRGGAGPHPPEAGGMVLPPPARDRSRSTACPPAPAAGSHKNRGEQASPRQRARTPHRSRPEKAGEHEPEWYGGHAAHDRNDASDTRFVACPGKAEGQNEAEQPPALRAPRRTNGGHGARAAAPPPSPPPGTRTPWTRPTGGAQPQAR